MGEARSVEVVTPRDPLAQLLRAHGVQNSGSDTFTAREEVGATLQAAVAVAAINPLQALLTAAAVVGVGICLPVWRVCLHGL